MITIVSTDSLLTISDYPGRDDAFDLALAHINDVYVAGDNVYIRHNTNKTIVLLYSNVTLNAVAFGTAILLRAAISALIQAGGGGGGGEMTASSTQTSRFVSATYKDAGTITIDDEDLSLDSANVQIITVIKADNTAYRISQATQNYALIVDGLDIIIYNDGELIDTLEDDDEFLVGYEGLPPAFDVDTGAIKSKIVNAISAAITNTINAEILDIVSYNSDIDALKIAEISNIASQNTPLALNNATLATGTHYFPSETGYEMGRNKHLTIGGEIIAPSESSVTFNVQVCLEATPETSSKWVTISGYDYASEDTLKDLTVTNATRSIVWAFENLNVVAFRLRAVVTTLATGIVLLDARVKAL